MDSRTVAWLLTFLIGAFTGNDGIYTNGTGTTSIKRTSLTSQTLTLNSKSAGLGPFILQGLGWAGDSTTSSATDNGTYTLTPTTHPSTITEVISVFLATKVGSTSAAATGSSETFPGVSNNSDSVWASASASSCNREYLNHSSFTRFTTTSFKVTALSTTRESVNYPSNATFTLCDHYAQAHGPPVTKYVAGNYTTTYTETLTSWSSDLPPKPSCYIGTAGCSMLWSSYNSAVNNLNFDFETGVMTSLPACASPGPTDPIVTRTGCTIVSSEWDWPDHPACTVRIAMSDPHGTV